MPSVTFDPAAKGGTVTLSNGNLTATKTASTDDGARTTSSFTNQKLYCEVLIGTAGNGFTFGVCNSLLDPDNPTSTLSNYVFALDTGDVYKNSVVLGSSGRLGATGTNGRMTIAVDLVNMQIWFKNAAGNWNGDASANPATNTNGIDISNLGAAGTPIYFAASAFTSGQAFTLKPGSADWTYSAPSGFASINDNVGVLAATDAKDTASFGSAAWDIAKWDVAIWALTDSLQATEAKDTFAATGSFATIGTANMVEATDIAAITGAQLVTGSMAVTDGRDAFSATASFATVGSLAATEASDQFFGFQLPTNTGTLGATDAADTFAGSGSFATVVVLAAAEAQDVATIPGVFIPYQPAVGGIILRDANGNPLLDVYGNPLYSAELQLLATSNLPAAGGGANGAWKWPKEEKAQEAPPEAEKHKGLSDPLKLRNARVRGNRTPSAAIRQGRGRGASVQSSPIRQRVATQRKSAPQEYVIKSRW